MGVGVLLCALRVVCPRRAGTNVDICMRGQLNGYRDGEEGPLSSRMARIFPEISTIRNTCTEVLYLGCLTRLDWVGSERSAAEDSL